MQVKNLAWNENLNKRCNHRLNLLLLPGWLDYNNTNIFGKSLFHPEDHILKKSF